ncbi:Sec1-like protein [Sphaerosporella brunnea]|uniref:Sec1-like protein n=1 Tax=Sphaerosporella brunnea TaxID=1250544 RepID=A0A5J5ESH1_9PEZI|nr:Sec1-like protein [Sphaerosporella brunnea]
MAPTTGIDTAHIKDTALKDLLDLLEGVRGKKILFLDRTLSGPVGLFAKFSVLQDYGVDKIFWLDEQVTDYPQKNIVYLARCTVKNAYTIANQIKNNAKIPGQEFEHSVFLAPRRTLVCDKIFEDEGILGEITIREFPLYFIPLENDLLSLELENSFEELYLRKDHTSIFYSARALMSIQRHHGLFPRIIGKGDRARKLADQLMRMRTEEDAADGSSPFALTPSSTLGELIVIDRDVDFVTPLMTQLTYEGLIDETIGISNSKIELDAALVGPPQQQQSSNNVDSASSSSKSPVPTAQQKKRPVLLSSEDKLFDNLRDTNFAIVGSLLNKVARRLNDDYEGRHQAKTVSEIRQFVSKLGGLQQEHQSLRLHTGLAEEIMKQTRSEMFNKVLEVQQNLVAGVDPSSQHDAIEELIARAAPLDSVLRLLCIESYMSGGLRPKDFENFKREILHAYGYQHVLTLDALEKLGFFQSRTAVAASNTSRTSYTALRKPLRLIVDEVNEHDPDDISYVYSGYAPLSVRLVQCVVQKALMTAATKGRRGEDGTNAGVNTGAVGWRGFEDVLKNVGGKTFDEPQRGEEKAVRARNILNGQNEKKVTVVFFLGGCTYTEISALRFIGRKEEARRQIVIGTTALINGSKMIKAAMA